MRLSRAPCQSVDRSSRNISQLRIFLGRRRNRRSRYLPRLLPANVADEPSVKAACIVAENVRLVFPSLPLFSFRSHINLSNCGQSSFPVSSIRITKYRGFQYVRDCFAPLEPSYC